jgi:hypothetical protein
MTQMKRIELLALFFMLACWAIAQDIEVKKFEPLEKDQTAVTSPRKDINGTACGLVKVALKEAGAEFEGNVMGDVQFTGKEYLVYLPNGTMRLGIKHPDYLPTTIVFADYGTKRVASSTTYELKVKANKKKAKIDNSKKGMAVFNIKPSNAMLLIDGQIADGSGGAYTLSLPYGTHYYTVKLKDFSINNQMVKIDKNAKNINVDLTEFFAKVSVNCPTEDAELTINGEQKGVGRWEGMMIPGKYTIEASKDGCHSQVRQIDLKDNDEVAVDFTKLKTITGSLRVDYEPAGADVLLNGKKVGVTPLVIKELSVGDYQLEIWKEYYVKEFATVKIAEDQEWKESGELKLTQFGNMVFPEAGGWIEGQTPIEEYPWPLIEYYRTGAASGYKGDHYACDKDSFDIPLNPVRGVYWLKKAVSLGDEGAIRQLEPFQSLINNEEKLSFEMAKKDVENTDEELREMAWYVGLPYAALAWHYFYGIGCERNVSEAKRLIKLACHDDGQYNYRSYKQLIKDMGLESELKYVNSNDE